MFYTQNLMVPIRLGPPDRSIGFYFRAAKSAITT